MIKLPILVNDREVGQIIIMRQRTAGVGSNEEWRYQRYRWEARLYDKPWAADCGEVQHQPQDGIFHLIGLVGAKVRNPAMSKAMRV